MLGVVWCVRWRGEVGPFFVFCVLVMCTAAECVVVQTAHKGDSVNSNGKQSGIVGHLALSQSAHLTEVRLGILVRASQSMK